MAFSQLQLNRAPSPFTSAASCQRRSCHPLPSRRSTLLTVAGVVVSGRHHQHSINCLSAGLIVYEYGNATEPISNHSCDITILHEIRNALRTWREGNFMCLQQPGDLVTVVGAAGGVGQILTAKLLEVCASPPVLLLSAYCLNCMIERPMI